MHVIAAKAVAFKEALEPDFKSYIQQVLDNARALAGVLSENGFRIVSGGTDTHLMLVDVTQKKLTGKQAEKTLELAGMTVNKNAIPFDKNPPMTASGIRIGTPAVTTRGMKQEEMRLIGSMMTSVLLAPEDEAIRQNVRRDVETLAARFPIYSPRIEKYLQEQQVV